ncbi:bcl-2-like protein 10 [Nannospalax galili]|uniref:Bcl-2-like protein 10 n=1 Tax=Nannospalax galili TaxID=1026970 RepID=A0A8C6WBP6_NANGA|nr:bcl-2-like protein 10 [Nannospalax galili]
MADPLRERTRQLLIDYLLFCAREPGTRELPPSSSEAAVLRSVAAQTLQLHQPFFSSFRGYQGNSLELLSQMADVVLSDQQSLNWGRVVVLVAFAGMLLDQSPCKNTKGRNRLHVLRDCLYMVDLLCTRLTGRHRAWLEAQDDWDGFCRFFRRPFPLSFWRRLLLQMFLSCFFAIGILYLWKRL